MKEWNSLDESLLEKSLWPSRDIENSGIWLKNKHDVFHLGFLMIFYPWEFFPIGSQVSGNTICCPINL